MCINTQEGRKGKKTEDKIDIGSYRNARVVVARAQSASSDLSMVIDARFV